MDMDNAIIKALSSRAAIKKYQPGVQVSAYKLTAILNAGRMAPSSNGLEPWKFIVINNSDIRAKLRQAAYGQPQVSEAGDFVVLAAQTDRKQVVDAAVARMASIEHVEESSLQGYRNSVEATIGNMSDQQFIEFAKQQVFIALGFMLETAALLVALMPTPWAALTLGNSMKY